MDPQTLSYRELTKTPHFGRGRRDWHGRLVEDQDEPREVWKKKLLAEISLCEPVTRKNLRSVKEEGVESHQLILLSRGEKALLEFTKFPSTKRQRALLLALEQLFVGSTMQGAIIVDPCIGVQTAVVLNRVLPQTESMYNRPEMNRQCQKILLEGIAPLTYALAQEDQNVAFIVAKKASKREDEAQALKVDAFCSIVCCMSLQGVGKCEIFFPLLERQQWPGTATLVVYMHRLTKPVIKLTKGVLNDEIMLIVGYVDESEWAILTRGSTASPAASLATPTTQADSDNSHTPPPTFGSPKQNPPPAPQVSTTAVIPRPCHSRTASPTNSHPPTGAYTRSPSPTNADLSTSAYPRSPDPANTHPPTNASVPSPSPTNTRPPTSAYTRSPNSSCEYSLGAAYPSMPSPTSAYPLTSAYPRSPSPSGVYPPANTYPRSPSPTGAYPQTNAHPRSPSPTGAYPQTDVYPRSPSPLGAYVPASAYPRSPSPTGAYPQTNAYPRSSSPTGAYPQTNAYPRSPSPTGAYPQTDVYPRSPSPLRAYVPASAYPRSPSPSGAYPRSPSPSGAYPRSPSPSAAYPLASAYPRAPSPTGAYPRAVSPSNAYLSASVYPRAPSPTGAYPSMSDYPRSPTPTAYPRSPSPIGASPRSPDVYVTAPASGAVCEARGASSPSDPAAYSTNPEKDSHPSDTYYGNRGRQRDVTSPFNKTYLWREGDIRAVTPERFRQPSPYNYLHYDHSHYDHKHQYALQSAPQQFVERRDNPSPMDSYVPPAGEVFYDEEPRPSARDANSPINRYPPAPVDDAWQAGGSYEHMAACERNSYSPVTHRPSAAPFDAWEYGRPEGPVRNYDTHEPPMSYERDPNSPVNRRPSIPQYGDWQYGRPASPIRHAREPLAVYQRDANSPFDRPPAISGHGAWQRRAFTEQTPAAYDTWSAAATYPSAAQYTSYEHRATQGHNANAPFDRHGTPPQRRGGGWSTTRDLNTPRGVGRRPSWENRYQPPQGNQYHSETTNRHSSIPQRSQSPPRPAGPTLTLKKPDSPRSILSLDPPAEPVTHSIKEHVVFSSDPLPKDGGMLVESLKLRTAAGDRDCKVVLLARGEDSLISFSPFPMADVKRELVEVLDSLMVKANPNVSSDGGRTVKEQGWVPDVVAVEPSAKVAVLRSEDFPSYESFAVLRRDEYDKVIRQMISPLACAIALKDRIKLAVAIGSDKPASQSQKIEIKICVQWLCCVPLQGVGKNVTMHFKGVGREVEWGPQNTIIIHHKKAATTVIDIAGGALEDYIMLFVGLIDS